MKINVLECVERTVRASHDGTEIVRLFYVDPYQAHPYVMAALLGGTELTDPNEAESEDNLLKRRKPSRDSYFPECYCTDAWIDQAAKEAMAGSDSIRPGSFSDGSVCKSDTDLTVSHIAEYLGYTKEVPRGASETVKPNGVMTNAGCYIRAIYKPLICEDPKWNSEACGFTPDLFDFVDPQMHPSPKVISCGAGLKYLIESHILYADVGSEGVVTQPMQQFTIRRIMCPSIPTVTINKLFGKVNGAVFSIGKFLFPIETLRFDSCEVLKHAVPSSDGTFSVWYDLFFNFMWNPIWDEYWAGTEFMPGYVGWNRILGRPNLVGAFGVVYPADLDEKHLKAPISYYRVGWKSDIFGPYRPLYLSDTKTNGVDTGTTLGFYDLFNPASQ